MEHKEDIGTLIKKKFGDPRQQPDDGLWDRIEGSLDQRDRMRRNFMMLWITGGAVAVLLFLLLLNASGISESDSEGSFEDESHILTQVDSILNASEVNSEKNITYEEIESLLADSLQTKIKTAQKESKGGSSVTGESLDTSVETGDAKKRDGFSEENVTIKTVYHYYNSTTKEVFETTDKKVIDSLIDNGNKETDSVQVIEIRIPSMKKKDSLG